jgi:hypothetical protein
MLEPGRVPVFGSGRERLLEQEAEELMKLSGLAKIEPPKGRVWRVPY